MNERIQLLADQARKKPMGDSWCYTSPKEFEQKFAELIIGSCLVRVDIIVAMLDKAGKSKEAIGAESVGLAIEKYFKDY